jgi:chemotaxis protein MotB
MKLKIFIPMLFIVAIAASSCVSNKKYKELQANYDKLDSNTREMRGKYLLTERNFAVATDRIKSLD